MYGFDERIVHLIRFHLMAKKVELKGHKSKFNEH